MLTITSACTDRRWNGLRKKMGKSRHSKAKCASSCIGSLGEKPSAARQQRAISGSKTHAHHKQVMAGRYPGYSFLKFLLDLAYCWAHVRRDFLEERSEEKDRARADLWVARIGEIYTLNKARLALGCALRSHPPIASPGCRGIFPPKKTSSKESGHILGDVPGPSP